MSKIKIIMKNQKVGTAVGTGILVIFSLTVFMFVWTYEKNLPQINAPISTVVVPEKTVSVIREPKEEDVEDCSGHEEEKRICKDGALVDMFDSRCLPTRCSSGKAGESSETSYYSPYIRKGQGIFLESPYDEELEVVVGADAVTFRPIGICGSLEMSSSYYGKDKNHVYVGSEPTDLIDSDSFQYLVLLRNGYSLPYSKSISIDKNYVYIGCGTRVNSVDRNSLSLLERGYFKDKNRVYYIDSIVGAADYRTFEIPSTFEDKGSQSHLGNFAMDKNHVFVEGQVLTGIDPKVCKSRGLDICLPSNWEDLIDDSETEVLPDLYEE